MQLSNKLYSYKNSTLALMPVVLNEIRQNPMPVEALYIRVRPALIDPTEFMSVMNCLDALRATDINEEGEVFICL